MTDTKIKLFLKIALALLCLFTVLWVASCAKGGEIDTVETDAPTEPAASDASEEAGEDNDLDTLDLVADGKSLYEIIRPLGASQLNKTAAAMIRDQLKSNKIKVVTDDLGDATGEKREILVGFTKYFPHDAIADIDLDQVGVDGFLIKRHEKKILIAANNDTALIDAAEFFIENFLDFEGGRISMPKDYSYVSSSGLFLNDISLLGTSICEYSISADAGMEKSAGYLKELIFGKCRGTLAEDSQKKIVLTAQGAEGSTVGARFEDGNLVIRAKDAKDMKKAVVCFWYENIAYTTASCDLSSDLEYSRDLATTVFYSDFADARNARGEDIDILYAAHNYANENGYKVFADYGSQFYIGVIDTAVSIKTDVEWGNARINIDDSNVAPDAKRSVCIFNVQGSRSSYDLAREDIPATISREDTKLDIPLEQKSMVRIFDSTKKQYIRKGGNADDGSQKQDMIVVDKDGNIDMDAPIMWDFDNITAIAVIPIDEETLYVRGGIFTTYANRAPSEYTYYSRGIYVSRSNTVVDGLVHYIKGEGATGAPYSGFINISVCAYVNVQNCVFSGHKTYMSSTTAMGSYDIGMSASISVTFLNCTQATDINDGSIWGVAGTNYCKNFVYDSCVLSRFDAHCGVTNAAIKNSVIGYWGANIIGYGTFLVENSTFMNSWMLNMRDDYGSTWEGDIIIRNCTLAPHSSTSEVTLIRGYNNGDHYFGYTCYMPKNVIIDGLDVGDASVLNIFADLNPSFNSDDFVAEYPHIPTEKISIGNLKMKESGIIKISPNEYIFKDTELVVEK